MKKPDNSPHTNRRPRFGFEGFGFFGRWIRCQRPFPEAVGERNRRVTPSAHILS